MYDSNNLIIVLISDVFQAQILKTRRIQDDKIITISQRRKKQTKCEQNKKELKF